MLTVENLTKKFGEHLILDNVNFSVNSGEVVGLLGPNGAGKTTTMKIITGFWNATSGTVLINDWEVAKRPLECKKRLGYLPETVPLYNELKVYEYLKFIGAMRQLTPEQLPGCIKEVVWRCGLQSVVAQDIGALSKGFRQRVGLAQAIIHDPDILILDEPTSGLDPNQIVEIRELIKQIGQHKTVLFSTHILSEAEATCDRLLIIHQGKIVAAGKLSELLAQFNAFNLETVFRQLTL